MLNSLTLKIKQLLKSKLFWLILTILLLLTYPVISSIIALRISVNLSRSVDNNAPAAYGLTAENVTFESEAGGRILLEGWWITNPASRRTMILLHGQNSNRAEFLPLAKEFYAKGYNLLLFDMRGHGKSGGFYHSYGFFEQDDLVAAVNFVKISKGIPAGSIGVFGGSMGGAVAILGTSRTPDIKATVADSPFAYWAERTKKRFGFFYPGVDLATRLLLGYEIGKIQPVEAVKQLGQRKLLIIHGTKDSIIPIEDSYDLQKAGGSNVALWVVPDTGHVAAFQTHHDEYLQRVLTFFDNELAAT